MQLLLFAIYLFSFLYSSVAQVGREAFQITSGSKAYLSASDIFRFTPNSYTGSPWNLDMTKIVTVDYQKSIVFWVRHNMTTPPAVDVPVIKGASKQSSNPSVALEAHFYVVFAANGANTELRLKYFATATTVQSYTIVSGTTMEPFVWYGVFVSRRSSASEDGVLFVYDPSNGYTNDLQTSTATPVGFTATPPLNTFYIDVGGDLTGSKACSCEIANVNFFYNSYYTATAADMTEYIKAAPSKNLIPIVNLEGVLLSLEFREIDSTLELVEDISSQNNVVFRGDNQFDTNKNTQLNYDQTANGDIGHIYTLDAFDTIYPAFDLGREFAVSFWIQFNTKPASVADDTSQYVFFKQNSQYTDMKLVVGFEAAASPGTTITKIKLQAGATLVSQNLNAITRGAGNWQYFYVYLGNLLKNDSLGTYHPTTLYRVIYLDQTATMQVLSGTIDDSWIDGGTTDLMRIGMGEDGQAQNLYAVLKKFQIISGGWAFQATTGNCDYYVGTPTLQHVTEGIILSSIHCLTCTATNNLYQDSCQAACPSGSYNVADTNFLHCEDCYYNCDTCSGRKPTQCSACFIGNWDPFGDITCPGAQPCTNHQYFDGIACQECDDSCATCPSGTKCSACSQGLDYNLATSQCEVAVCGDGKVNAGEQCDDGNLFDGDGCTVDCTIELGWYCPSTGGDCYSICGDNVRASNEECDDGNNAELDGCDYNCKTESGYFCTVPATPGPFFGAAYQETCSLCDNAFCDVCLDASTCGKCVAGKFLDGTTCVASCGAGTYQNTTTSKCEPCPQFCATCTSSTVCTACSGSNSLLNQQCYEFCPDGKYSDIDTDTLRKCFTCNANCLTCSSSTYCYTCPTNRYLNVVSGTVASCDLCDASCQTCRGPLDTDCVLCPAGSLFQSSTSKCVTLTCLATEYLDISAGTCEACDTSCATCSGGLTTDCLTCPQGTFLSSEGRCISCTTANGLMPQSDGSCLEICGDGRRVLNATGCDDGNIVPYDGCSNDCKVETGWQCNGGDESSPDLCESFSAPRPIVTTSSKDPSSIMITFNKKVMNTITNNQLYTDIKIDIEGLNPQDSPYKINYDAKKQRYYVNFRFTKSVIGAYITVEFKYPSRISDEFGNIMNPAKTTVSYPNFYYLDEGTKNNAERLAIFDYVLEGIAIIFLIPLAIQGKISYFWMYLEFFQLVNYVIFINVRHPYLSEKFMKSMMPLQLKWLPNIPQYIDINYNHNAQTIPDKFEEEDKNAFFLENAGTQSTIWTFTVLVFLGAKIVKAYNSTYESKRTRNAVNYILEISQWSLLLRAIVLMFFDFSLASFLSVRNTGFEKGVLAASTILGIFGLIFMTGFPLGVYLRIRSLNKRGLLENDKRSFTLHNDFAKESKFTSHFIVVILIQKILFAAVLVWLQSSPEAQITLLIILEIVMVFIYIIYRPYHEPSMNVRAIWQEFSLFAALCMLYGVLDENTEDSVRNEDGRIIVALLLSTFLMHTIFIVKEGIMFSYKSLKGDITAYSKQKYVHRKMLEAKKAKLKAAREEIEKKKQKIDLQVTTERPNYLDLTEDQKLLRVEIRPNSKSDIANKTDESFLPKTKVEKQ